MLYSKLHVHSSIDQDLNFPWIQRLPAFLILARRHPLVDAPPSPFWTTMEAFAYDDSCLDPLIQPERR